MKELNTFRQFLAEGKEEKVSEDKIERAIKDTLKKEGGAAGIDPLKKAVKSLNVDTDFDIEKFLKKMSNVEKHKNGDYILTPLKENDEVLDAILNEENLNEDDIKSENDMRDFAVKAFTNNGFPKPAKLEVVGADKNKVKDANIMLELRERQHYKKKSDERREKRNLAILRQRYKEEKQKNSY